MRKGDLLAVLFFGLPCVAVALSAAAISWLLTPFWMSIKDGVREGHDYWEEPS